MRNQKHKLREKILDYTTTIEEAHLLHIDPNLLRADRVRRDKTRRLLTRLQYGEIS